jgi:hypothetical protein
MFLGIVSGSLNEYYCWLLKLAQQRGVSLISLLK